MTTPTIEDLLKIPLQGRDIQELADGIEALVLQGKIDEVKSIRKQFHQKRFGISEFMNDRIKELERVVNE